MFRCGHACSLFKEEIWVAGGGTDGDYLDVVEILNLETETWRAGPSMVKPRSWLTLETVENTLLLVGGDGGGPSTLERLVGGEWIEEPLKYGHAEHASIVIPCV